jgi:hypothetical protein
MPALNVLHGNLFPVDRLREIYGTWLCIVVRSHAVGNRRPLAIIH